MTSILYNNLKSAYLTKPLLIHIYTKVFHAHWSTVLSIFFYLSRVVTKTVIKIKLKLVNSCTIVRILHYYNL